MLFVWKNGNSNVSIDLKNLGIENFSKLWKFSAQIDQLVNHQEKIYERTIADIEVQRIEDTEVDHICSKCGHGKATYSTQQTRSADEGQTVFYTCTKCKQKSIEYSWFVVFISIS